MISGSKDQSDSPYFRHSAIPQYPTSREQQWLKVKFASALSHYASPTFERPRDNEYWHQRGINEFARCALARSHHRPCM